jgi:hypothetical protein
VPGRTKIQCRVRWYDTMNFVVGSRESASITVARLENPTKTTVDGVQPWLQLPRASERAVSSVADGLLPWGPS